MRKVDTLVVDLDNTLWDWVAMWHATFRAELDKIIDISGLPEAILKEEIRVVHQRYGTSEFAFLLEELPSLRDRHPGQDLLVVYASAIEAFRETRRRVLRLYPGVLETLDRIRAAGTLIVAYTESQAFYTSYRVRKLDLDSRLDFLYSPADHDMPAGLSREEIRKYPEQAYELTHAVHRHTPAGELKPNPDILLSILADIGTAPENAAYVGDSLMKDVAMAQDAGVVDVYAKYGNVRDSEAYQLLRDVTHWTDRDVERERRIHDRGEIVPTHVAENSLADVLNLFAFVTHSRHMSHAGTRD